MTRGLTSTLSRAVGAAVRRLRSAPAPTAGREQGASFYDRTFDENPEWRAHYTASSYYFIWTVIVDRIRRAGARSVLEIGCGSGQLAHAISDAGTVAHYVGVDFSAGRVGQARRNCPHYRFEVADVFETDVFDMVGYDLVLATEFLEHVERDLDVLGRIRPGAHVIATVPNFPFVSHVRHFGSAAQVTERYAPLLQDLSVDTLLANERGKTFYLLEGTRKAQIQPRHP